MMWAERETVNAEDYLTCFQFHFIWISYAVEWKIAKSSIFGREFQSIQLHEHETLKNQLKSFDIS